MSDLTALEARLGRIFERRMNLLVPSAETDLFETGVMDSLSFVELLLELEREFGVRASIEDLELDNFRSVARIAQFIAARHALKRTDTVRPIKNRTGP